MILVVVDNFGHMLFSLMWKELSILKIGRVAAERFEVVANFSYRKNGQ